MGFQLTPEAVWNLALSVVQFYDSSADPGVLAYLLLFIPGLVFVIFLKFTKVGTDSNLDIYVEKSELVLLATALGTGISLAVLSFLYAATVIYLLVPFALPFIDGVVLDSALTIIIIVSYLWFSFVTFDQIKQNNSFLQTYRQAIMSTLLMAINSAFILPILLLLLAFIDFFIDLPNINRVSDLYTLIIGIAFFSYGSVMFGKISHAEQQTRAPQLPKKIRDKIMLLPYEITLLPYRLVLGSKPEKEKTQILHHQTKPKWPRSTR